MTEHTALLVPERQKVAGQSHPSAWRSHSIVLAKILLAHWLDDFK